MRDVVSGGSSSDSSGFWSLMLRDGTRGVRGNFDVIGITLQKPKRLKHQIQVFPYQSPITAQPLPKHQL
ncbi:unnamed protein product [Dovyalis caffra]|uniref:Uncharacterized protein n=1 Tax=Dovyalis caffra TaxID=77055 RepID=A0AAV1SAL3_9ROSI|nr:unnamed protein product [Dovyalis caffra]